MVSSSTHCNLCPLLQSPPIASSVAFQTSLGCVGLCGRKTVSLILQASIVASVVVHVLSGCVGLRGRKTVSLILQASIV